MFFKIFLPANILSLLRANPTKSRKTWSELDAPRTAVAQHASYERVVYDSTCRKQPIKSQKLLMAEKQRVYAMCSQTPLPLRIIAFSYPQVYTFCTPLPDLILNALHPLSKKVRIKIPIHPSHTVRFMPFSYTFRGYQEKTENIQRKSPNPCLSRT